MPPSKTHKRKDRPAIEASYPLGSSRQPPMRPQPTATGIFSDSLSIIASFCSALITVVSSAFSAFLRLFAPYIVAVLFILLLLRVARDRVASIAPWAAAIVSCDGPILPSLPVLAYALCGTGANGIEPGSHDFLAYWCDHGGALLTATKCKQLDDDKQKSLHKALGVITKATFETVDQGRQLIIRTHNLPSPHGLALRSTHLHSLQWAVLYHTNFTKKDNVAEGLRTTSNKLDSTVDTLIELKADAEHALVSMVDRFDSVERALRGTLDGRRTLEDMEGVFDDALRITDEELAALLGAAVTAREKALATKAAVQGVQRLLAEERRGQLDGEENSVNPLLGLFCKDCLTKSQARQLRQDLDVWNDCNSQISDLSRDLTSMGVELSQFRKNVALVRDSWRRNTYARGDVVDQIESLRGRVSQLRSLMAAGPKIDKPLEILDPATV
ncbi:hypothetical protein HDU87_003935 [Geranomyces variabilis]|uniref:Uncharacterized protein n=1 Tax=Geranomyces variabilis TaxID=109894 RepID=A0AAD5TQV8_9FUNG|nr:hypothetical protein HDU87_003935 [Geranomyces variabilis]